MPSLDQRMPGATTWPPNGAYESQDLIISIMADCILCSCVTCPKCGSWVVLRSRNETGSSASKFKTFCPAPGCNREFEFTPEETQTFEVSLALFERRHFYRSELHEPRT